MAKILFISPKDNNFYNFRSEKILKIKDLGHEVVLICPYGKKIDYFTERGCRFINLPMDRRGKSLFNDLKLVLQYHKIMKAEKPDVVSLYTSKPSIYGGFVCGCMKIPYIVNNAGLMVTKGLFDKFMKLLYKLGWSRASCIMYQNTGERDIINKVLANKVHYRDIPGSGVNLSDFVYKPYPKNDDKIIFNFVARIVDFKGINEYLTCAEVIKAEYSNVEFRIFGDFDDEEYRQRIQDLESKGIVKYMGVQMNMRPFVEECHAVIHSSYYEGMTNVVLEHSATGRPCIGSDVPGVREGIEDGKTGYIFAVKNSVALICAVRKFLALSHEQKATMGKNAREKMEKEFDRNIVTNIYIEEINRILASKKY